MVPSTASEVPLSGAATNYGFTQPATAAALPPGVGSSRYDADPDGLFRRGYEHDRAGTAPIGITGTTVLSTDAANNRVAADLDQRHP